MIKAPRVLLCKTQIFTHTRIEASWQSRRWRNKDDFKEILGSYKNWLKREGVREEGPNRRKTEKRKIIIINMKPRLGSRWKGGNGRIRRTLEMYLNKNYLIQYWKRIVLLFFMRYMANRSSPLRKGIFIFSLWNGERCAEENFSNWLSGVQHFPDNWMKEGQKAATVQIYV